MTSTSMHDPDPAPVDELEPFEPVSNSMRRSGRVGTRILAVLSLLAALGAVGYVLSTWLGAKKPEPLAAASADAWQATGALSASLKELRPTSSRAPARKLVGGTAQAVAQASRRVAKLDVPTADVPRRRRVLSALTADAEWIDAVGSTLGNPTSPRRAELSRLAKAAATSVSLIADDVDGARGTVSGTGRLLAATKQR